MEKKIIEHPRATSFVVGDYINMDNMKMSYGVIANFGRKKADKRSIPLLFTNKNTALKYCKELSDNLIELTHSEATKSESFGRLIKKYKRFANNIKKKPILLK